MKRLAWIVAIIVVPLIAVLLIAAQLFLTGPSRLNPSELPDEWEITVAEPPAAEPSAAEPSAPPSTLTIPVRIPLATVRAALERAAPRRVCGGEGGLFNEAWCFNRQDLSVSGNGDAIVVSADMDGVVDPPFMSEISVRGTARMGAHLGFSPDWRIIPNMSASVELDEALYTPLFFETRDVRDMIEAPMRNAVEQQRLRLQSSIAGDDTFERAARETWDSLCRNVPLGSGAASSLHLRPQRAAAPPAQVEGDYVRVQFGLDIETWIGPPEGEAECPFPGALQSAAPNPGGFTIHLPIAVGYEPVRDAVADLVEGLVPEDTARWRVDRVELRHYMGRVFASVELSVRLPGLFGGWSEATIHILARPRVKAEAGTIWLSDLELDTESTHVLLAIAGEALEPSMRSDLGDDSLIELSSLVPAMVDEWRAAIERDLEARLGHDVRLTATVTGTSLADLAFFPERVSAIGTLTGDLSVTLGSPDVPTR